MRQFDDGPRSFTAQRVTAELGAILSGIVGKGGEWCSEQTTGRFIEACQARGERPGRLCGNEARLLPGQRSVEPEDSLCAHALMLARTPDLLRV